MSDYERIPYKKGDRVYTKFVHEETKEEKRRYGTVTDDEIEMWDYINVNFDDFPMVQPVLVYYLFKEETDETR